MARIRAALDSLHSAEKVQDGSDQLVLLTLGSQEGAFEIVRMNYSGEQVGRTRKYLIWFIHYLCVLQGQSGSC